MLCYYCASKTSCQQKHKSFFFPQSDFLLLLFGLKKFCLQTFVMTESIQKPNYIKEFCFSCSPTQQERKSAVNPVKTDQ